jgi:hypothetical protein
MTFRRILQLLSFGTLLYLLVDAFMHIEFAASKNNALTIWQKAEIDSIQNIDSLKHKAKANLDTIRRIHRTYSSKAVMNFWLLVGLIMVHAFLLFSRHKKAATINGR